MSINNILNLMLQEVHEVNGVNDVVAVTNGNGGVDGDD